MKLKQLALAIAGFAILSAGCKNMNKSQKGTVIGVAGGAVVGAVIGKAAGNTAMGAIIGATVGGVAGAIIGQKMDKQAEEIKKEVPGVKVERVGEGIVIEFNSDVLFGFDQAFLTQDATSKLDDLATVLKKYQDTDIEIQGHTDDKGTDSYNEGLSIRRANTVSEYLKVRNVAASRIAIKGFGENAPEYSNETDAGRAQNRRVEFLITANEKMVEEAKKEAGGK